uniref:[Ribosomal protein bS18]-alanine N-acetyltransferase n=1 Tax=uncultured Fidelibacterota bacterium HF0500_01L02 TaxID=710790 RepID=E0XY00_9BACT|nr:acetyltransferases [uncultured Marinimicrobia bacterium HF0500_01L02]
MRIRKANLSDLNLIHQIENRVFSDSWSKDSIKQELIKPSNALIIISEINGKVMGYFFAHIFNNEVHILNIAIDIPFQHQGLGKQLLDKIMKKYLKEADVFLEVKRTNFPAINLYLSFGFEEIDIRQGYYTDGQDAFIMSKKVYHHGVV